MTPIESDALREAFDRIYDALAETFERRMDPTIEADFDLLAEALWPTKPTPEIEGLREMLLESNSWETGAKIPKKFTGREAGLLAEWLFARGLRHPSADWLRRFRRQDGEIT